MHTHPSFDDDEREQLRQAIAALGVARVAAILSVDRTSVGALLGGVARRGTTALARSMLPRLAETLRTREAPGGA
jgi:hypothetical protein